MHADCTPDIHNLPEVATQGEQITFDMRYNQSCGEYGSGCALIQNGSDNELKMDSRPIGADGFVTVNITVPASLVQTGTLSINCSVDDNTTPLAIQVTGGKSLMLISGD